MPCLCASKKLSATNISEADMELLIAQAMEFLRIDKAIETAKQLCPDAGAAMFAGYKVNNTSEDRHLLMVVLTDLPERLELFLTNSFSLPTMREEFPGNKTGSVK
eukprot:scaffold279244_cov50-Attheya_sp.AAC.1